jgi:hypothetical protein
MSGSHDSFNETDRISADFRCDGNSVSVCIYADGEGVGSKIYSREEAMAVGKRIAETGYCDDFPISADPADIKQFGNRLVEYGRSGR